MSEKEAVNGKAIVEIINRSRKIVIKIGSNTLADATGLPNDGFMENFARQSKTLIDCGKQLVVGADVFRLDAFEVQYVDDLILQF